jgi:hypothetical protein
MMTNLEKAKEIMWENYSQAECGIFNTHNVAGDLMGTIYDENGLRIDICVHYGYFEVFGLTYEEFEELERFYNSLEQFYNSLGGW